MSNRLEQEFPNTSWRVIPPVGPRGLDRDLVRHYIARSHRLRSQAARRSLRDANAGTRRAFAAVGAFLRGIGLARQRGAHGYWPRSAHGA